MDATGLAIVCGENCEVFLIVTSGSLQKADAFAEKLLVTL